MRKKVLTFISDEQLIEYGDRVAVALSGGADSMALLHLLLTLREVWALTIEAIHIHHGLREASDDEAVFVSDYCALHEVPLLTVKVDLGSDCYQGMSTEEAARNARYNVFEAYIIEHDCKIALGHHMNDQGETVLLNLFRGAGAQGLKGMLPQRGAYIRPLLVAVKEVILEYCVEYEVPYVTDESNMDTEYTRNALRHKIIPMITNEIQPNLFERLFQSSQILREEDAYLTELVQLASSEVVESQSPTKLVIDNKALMSLPTVLQRRFLRYAIGQFIQELHNVTFYHIEQVRKLVASDKTGKIIQLPGGWQVRMDYRQSVIELAQIKETSTNPHKFIDFESLEEKKEVIVEGFRLRILDAVNTADYPKNAYTKWIDYDKIGTNLVLRRRRPGDWLRLGATAYRKKLKDYFIDTKISRPEREEIPVFAIDQEVVWLVGYRINENYKVNDTTRHILEISLLKEEHQ